MNQMLKNYWMALTRPSTATFEELKASVKTSHTLIGLGIVGVASGLIALLDTMPALLSGAEGEDLIVALLTGAVGFAIVMILIPAFYYIGQTILWGIAKLLGGRGGLGRQVNLNATFGVPLGLIGALLGVLPFIGAILSWVVSIYAFFPLTLSLSVVHGYSKGGAFMTWFAIIVFAMLCVVCFLILLGPQIANVFERTIRGVPAR